MEAGAVRIGDVEIGPGAPLALVAGPCVIEDAASTLAAARFLRDLAQRLGLPLVFKSSYDKANRTRIDSYRGPGLEAGVGILRRVREEVGVPVLCDVHGEDEVNPVAAVADCLQVPAFLSRQTDLLLAAGRTGKPVNVKKGQFAAPEDMGWAVEKIRSAGGGGVLLTERGTTFGYHYLVVDFQGLVRLRQLGCPVVFDATHSVQRPAGRDGRSGGDRSMVAPLARAAAAVGVDALFLEVHRDPDRALCDGENSVPWGELEELLRSVQEVHRVARGEP